MRRPREVVCTLPSDAHTICAPWGRRRNLIRALAVGANRPVVALPGRVRGGQEVAPACAGRGRWVARSPQMHKASVLLLFGPAAPRCTLHPLAPRAIDLSCCGHLDWLFLRRH